MESHRSRLKQKGTEEYKTLQAKKDLLDKEISELKIALKNKIDERIKIKTSIVSYMPPLLY